jgi:chaperonin GroEL (HSP60 family)
MEDAVCTLIKKSVDGTNKYAGDGTTTSMVLIGEIMRLAAKKIECGVHSRQIRKGL